MERQRSQEIQSNFGMFGFRRRLLCQLNNEVCYLLIYTNSSSHITYHAYKRFHSLLYYN